LVVSSLKNKNKEIVAGHSAQSVMCFFCNIAEYLIIEEDLTGKQENKKQENVILL